DLRHWGSHKMILQARRGAWWDANKIGLSPPAIETPEGWLILYHGVRQTASGSLYRLGLALFDLNTPERCILRSDEWIFGPEEVYEREGDVANVVFPCGYTIAEDGDTLYLYYGGADTCIALATGSIREMLDWLKQHGHAGDHGI
ncbi:MAG: glycosidase, partial [Armatimonadetes bacterium]|nr:glycosidase [Armatimonadota bacterium]